MKNLNLLFNKLYYENLELTENGKASPTFVTSIEKYNEELWYARFDPNKDYEKSKINNVSTFYMKTSYPGVLVGTGYAHGSGIDGADADINCGFSFDYVSGQPYIPGSSIKGLIRSAFRNKEIIECFLSQDFSCSPDELERKIFGTKASELEGDDVFLDAVILCGDEQARIIGKDYITPHSNATKNPIPIHILKIMPDVIIEFRFVLKDTEINGQILKVTEKLSIYSSILELLGVGAKTNVGYGVLHKVYDNDITKTIENRKRSWAEQEVQVNTDERYTAQGRAPVQPSISNNFKRDKKYKGKICEIKGSNIYVEIDGFREKFQMKKAQPNDYKKGNEVDVIITDLGAHSKCMLAP